MNIKKILLFFSFWLSTAQLLAAVTVTPGNGGTNISADDKGTSNYTLINGPVLTEVANAEVGTGTIILNAPTGVVFDLGSPAPTVLVTRLGGLGVQTRNINSVTTGNTFAITSISTTQITITITSASSNGVYCSLTLQNIRVQPNSGAAGTGNITVSGTSVISGVNGSTNFATVTVVPGALNKMQLLMPGEVAAPGTGSGKTGTPTARTAGAAFNVTVNAVDANWNVVNSTNVASITSSDVNAILPADAALVAGTRVFGVELRTAGSRTVTVSNFTSPSITADVSPSTTVNAAAFSKLQLLMPGESASPGSSTGKTSTPDDQTAGTAFNVTVNAVDANWNLVNTVTDNIGITTSDVNAILPANAVLVSGTKTYSVTFKTAGSATITATDITDGAKTANTSPSTTVNAGAFTKMQLLVPGEVAAPGTGSGKTGTAYSQSIGSSFNVTVNAVDDSWNVVSSTNTIGITSSDGSATLPSNAALVAGTKDFSVTLNTAGSFTVTATNITDGTKTANTSPSLTVTLSVLTPSTGGSSISADNTGGSYTSLTGPTFTEGGSGDVGTGTIILNAPSGVIFDTGSAPTLLMNRVSGSGGDANNINGLADGATIALTSISTSQITFTISTASSSGVACSLTFQDVKVRPNSGAAGNGNLTKTGTSTMSGVINSVSVFGATNVVAGAFTKMQLLVPGETAAPGGGSGKTGSPTAASAGSVFNVTVNGVDQYWNKVNTTNTVAITSSDVNAALPSNAALVAGTQTFSVNLKTVGTATVTATNVTDGSKTANTSPSITVNAGAFAKLQLLVPGETAAPGTASGKTGTPSAQTAGTAFNVTVNAVDDAWNLVSSTNTIAITSSGIYATLPANAALVSGTETFSITLNAVGTRTITATNVTDGTKTANTSPNITVNVGAFVKMQILMPGETAAPGSASGKTGTPNAQSKGKAFTITVNSVDANWNVVSSTNTIAITSSDGTATLPANAALVAGTKTFSVTFNASSGTATVTATNSTDPSKTANTSPATTIVLATWDEATGGSAISADNTGTTWTTLTGPVYNEGLNADVGVGTIILNAPTGFIFDVTAAPTLLMSNIGGGVQDARQINGLAPGSTIALTSISTTQITFTITSVSNNASIDRLTFQNVKVRPSTGVVTTGNLTITGSSLMAGIVSGSTNFGTLNVVAGAFTKLQTLAPGVTSVPGAGSGKSGTPTNQTAGTAFDVTVNAVDQYWNLVNTVTHTIAITSSDANATLPANAALVAGTQTYSVNLKTAGTHTVTASNVTDPSKTANSTQNITVAVGAFTKMQLLMPGESAAPGTASGKTSVPNSQTAGASFNVTVNAVDANWNVITSSTNTVGITTSDANATLPSNAALVSGTKTYAVTFKTAGTRTVTATNITDGTKTANTSPNTTVNAGAFTKMQILMPGESADPGTGTGKSGSSTAQTAGSSFNVTVNAVDDNWNVVSSTNTVGITSSDANATLPADAALVAGTQTYSVTFKTAGTRTVTATNITDGTKTANTGANTTVSAGAFTKMQLLMPGESADPGTGTGKSGTPTDQTAGTSFNVTVNSVDANWNVVSSTNTIGITSSDANATLPADAALVAGTKTYSVIFKTAGTRTVTATNITDGSKTANTGSSTTVNAGAFTKMQLLMPGESADPGSGTGKTGTPTAQTAETSFNVTVNSVDANWNVVSSANTIGITSSDANAILPSNAALVAGTQTYSVTFKTSGTRTVTATNITDGTKTANTGANTTVNAGAFTKMQLLMPGESADPGTGTGKSGTPTDQTAGTSFNVTVNAVDANWNVVSSTNTVGITSSDANATLPADAALVAGTKTYSVTFKTAGTRTVTATNITDGTKTANTSPNTTVNAGAFVKMQLLVPGESADPGSASGKTGTPTAQTAGTSFNVTVNAVDANWNVVSSTNTVGISTTDFNATLPANAPLVAGTKTLSITLKTVSTPIIMATNITDGTKTANISPVITVNPGAFTKMQLLVPGESPNPGSASGKTGTPDSQIPGFSFNVTVNAVDAYWNKVTSAHTVGITSTDGSATLPSNNSLVAGTQTFSVTFNALGTWTITATNLTDGTKTANTSPTINATPKTWTGGGATTLWGDDANWDPYGVPTSVNDVDLTGANTIQIDVDAAINNLSLSNAGLSLSVDAGISLTVNGALIKNTGTFTADPSSTVIFNSAASQTIPALNYGHLTSASTGDRVFSSSGTIDIAGDFNLGTNTYTTTGSTLHFNGTSAQTITGNLTAHAIIIDNVSGVSLAGGSGITIDSLLTLSNGDFSTNGNSFIFNTDATMNGLSGNVIGSVTLNRTYEASGCSGNKYVQVASPLDHSLSNWTSWLSTGSGGTVSPALAWKNVFSYDETVSASGDASYVALTNSDQMLQGTGYFIYVLQSSPYSVGSSRINTVSGTVSLDDYTWNLSYTNGLESSEDGFNMLGNPFPGALTVGLSDVNLWEKTGTVDDAVYSWNGCLGAYAVSSGGVGVNGHTGEIPYGSAFWVRAGVAGSTLKVKRAALAGSTNKIYKKATPRNVLKLKISNISGTVHNQTAIRFHNNATINTDKDFDAEQFGHPATSIYSEIKNTEGKIKNYAINTIPSLKGIDGIKLRHRVASKGNYRLIVSDLNSFDNQSCILIEDLKTGTIIDPKITPEYSFTEDKSTDYQSRFIVRYIPAAEARITTEACSSDNKVVFNVGENAQLQVFNEKNKLIQSAFNVDSVVLTNLPVGNYSVQLKSNVAACPMSTTTFEITKKTPLELGFAKRLDATCSKDNGIIKAVATGGNGGYKFEWSNGQNGAEISNLKSGLYNVTVTDKLGCVKKSNDVSIANVIVKANFDFEKDELILSKNETLRVINKSNNASLYKWDFENGIKSTIKNPLPQNYTNAGDYNIKLIVRSENNCLDSITKKLIVKENSFGNNELEKERIIAYQVSNKIHIKSFINFNGTIELVDIVGKSIFNQKQSIPAESTFEIDMSSHKGGIYFIKADDNKKQVVVKVIFVKE